MTRNVYRPGSVGTTSTLPDGPSHPSIDRVRTTPSGDVTLSLTLDAVMPPNTPTTTRTRRTVPLTRSRSSTRSTIPAFGAGCDTSIHVSPRDAGPSIHGGAGMSLTTIVALVAHSPGGAAG